MGDPFAGAEPTIPPYAGWWRRFAALLIDGLLLTLPFVAAIVAGVAVSAGAKQALHDKVANSIVVRA